MPHDAFECDGDAACDLDGRAGRCIASGDCAYADDDCASGWRYHRDAARAASDACLVRIDDFDDQDLELPLTEGLEGTWWSFGTEFGNVEALPIAEPRRERSSTALHLVGDAGATGYYIAGIALRDVGEGVHEPFDASAFRGIAFWMKAGAATRRIAVKVWVCGTAAACREERSSFSTAVLPTREWSRVVVPFSSLAPDEPNAVWDPTLLEAIELASTEDGPFELWVDDLVFAP